MVENVRVLVVESRFNGKSIWLYVTCPDCVIDNPAQLRHYAERAAQAYCDRWQIEKSFYVIKQEFALEKVRVRTFQRLNNIFTLCVLAYVYVTYHIRRSPSYKKIVKLLSDNIERVSEKTRAFLASVRALLHAEKLRFITGRPKKHHVANALQMTLPGF